MATIFKNPDLTDYFVEMPDVTAETPLDAIPSVIEAYEAGKVIYFPNLKFDIDFEFWEHLPTDKYPNLKKISSLATADPNEHDSILDRHLAKAGLPPELEASIRPQVRRFYDKMVPIYERLFGDYRFTVRRATWRLNTIHNEDMHVDTYAQEFEEHFARMFINLDRQPRIWTTSFTIDEIMKKFGPDVSRDVLKGGTRAQVWKELNRAAFGPSHVWWDNQPRHVVYFDPGDVWIVDSRQVAHQIFYGRRAVSVDFFVDKGSMKAPDKHYLQIASDFQKRSATLSAASA